MEDMIELLHRIGNLKELSRFGWVSRDIPNPESVADHSFRTSIMALLLADGLVLDKNKCIQMALIHDIGESLIGDIGPHEKIEKIEKYRMEKEAVLSLFKNIEGNNVIDLWTEYENRKSPEAKFVYELDKIEMILQAFEYEKKYKGEIFDFSEFWSSVSTSIKDPKMFEILKILTKKRS